MNSIDYSLYSTYPISDCGYIPDQGIVVNGDLNDIIIDDISKIDLKDIKNYKDIDEMDLRVLFLKESKYHKFGKPYIDFLKFCLSMVSLDIDNSGMFFLEPDITLLKD